MESPFAQLMGFPAEQQMAAPPGVQVSTPSPTGGRLAQIRDMLQNDPNFRQAWMAGSAQMMQSPAAGQNSVGMIGQGLQHGMQTLDALRQRELAQKIDQERHAENVGLKKEGLGLQRDSLNAQREDRQEDRAMRVDENRRQRRFQSALHMSDQDLKRELARIREGTTSPQQTHPNVHLAQTEGILEYRANKDYYDAMSEERGGSASGLELATYERFNRLQLAKNDMGASERRIILRGQIDTFKSLYGDRWLDEILGSVPDEQKAAVMQEIRSLGENLSGPISPAGARSPGATIAPAAPRAVIRPTSGARKAPDTGASFTSVDPSQVPLAVRQRAGNIDPTDVFIYDSKSMNWGVVSKDEFDAWEEVR
jgi:hypothetical protein